MGEDGAEARDTLLIQRTSCAFEKQNPTNEYILVRRSLGPFNFLLSTWGLNAVERVILGEEDY